MKKIVQGVTIDGDGTGYSILLKVTHILIATIFLLIGGATARENKPLEVNKLSGNISITLKKALWKLWEGEVVYQDITIDVQCDRGRCQAPAWGYAPKFNADLDHQGTVEVLENHQQWDLDVTMQVQFHPDRKDSAKALYQIQLIPHEDKLIGFYRGDFNGRVVEGKATGKASALWPKLIDNHTKVQPQEHPRLIFRPQELPALRSLVQTPQGKAILARLQTTLATPIQYQGYVPTSGYHAAGHCFLAVLNKEPKAAAKGWSIVTISMSKPGDRLLERSPIVAGVALAYDMCYHYWSKEQKQEVGNWLAKQTVRLLKGDSPKRGWNSSPVSNWNARARGAAGLAALALWQEPANQFKEPIDPKSWAKIAQRNIKRYLDSAVGDRGFGSEGDLYTTEPWLLTLLPFVQASQQVLGEDMVKDSKIEWFIPHYLSRIVVEDKKLEISTYGRHRAFAGSGLFPLGFASTNEESLPALKWFFDSYLAVKGDGTFGIEDFGPYLAPYALYNYPYKVSAKNPTGILPLILVDEQKGFFNLRNGWQNAQDFVASIYLKKQVESGWSYPEVGSFRIRGLGFEWASAGPGPAGGEQKDENMIMVQGLPSWPKSELVWFDKNDQGSGIVTLKTQEFREKNNPKKQVYATRSFATDYSKASGSDGLFVVMDKFYNTIGQAINNPVWIMHTKGKVTIDGQSFLITAGNGATMKGTFITPTPVQIVYEEGKIQAKGGSEYFVVMTVQKGNPPAVKITGSGLEALVEVGGQKISVLGDRLLLAQFFEKPHGKFLSK